MRPKRIVAALAALAVGGAVVFVACNRHLTRLRLAEASGQVTAVRDLVYLEGSGHAKHRLDLYFPAGAEAVPVVHFVHGGYWTEGDKDHHRFATGLYGTVGEALARRGIGTVVQSYRLAPEVGIDGILDDVMAGLRWTQTHIAEHGGDTGRVFLMGHSAGGHLVALIGSDDGLHRARGMDPAAVRGYLPLSGIYDLADMHAQHDESFNRQVTVPTFGADRERWARYAPLTQFHAGMRPMLLMVGERDYPYLIPQAQRAAARLGELGCPAELVTIAGNTHADMVLRFGAKNDNMTDRVVAFTTAPR